MANAGQFKPGQSGNPGGRPKRIPKFVARFRELEPKAMKYLADVIEGKEAVDLGRIKAIELAFAYSRGRPRQQIEATGKDGGPLEIAVSGVLAAPPGLTVADWSKAVADNTAKIAADSEKT